MLSMEGARFVDLYRYNKGMVNTAWITGLVRRISPDRTTGFIQQTPNVNHWIPFKTRKGDHIPTWISDAQPVQMVARIGGRYDESTGVRVAELQALRFEVADTIAMPPSEVWDLVVPGGAPKDDTRPAFGKGGLKMSRTWNIVHLAGYIGAMRLEKPRMVPDTKPGVEPGAMRLSKGTLTILLHQEADPARAIPIRLRGGKVETIHASLRRGDPIFIMEGEIHVMTKAIEGSVPDANGIEPRILMPYVHAWKTQVATRDQIQARPEWVAGLEVAAKPAPAKAPAAVSAPVAEPLAEPVASEPTDLMRTIGLDANALSDLSS